MIDIQTPFPLAYIDWCKEVKKSSDLISTQRRDWVYEAGKLYHDLGGTITGLDLAIAMGTE